jgi:hypothetical protein
MSDPRTGLRCVVTSSPARRPRCCVPLRSALCFLYARSLPSHPHSLPPIRALPRLPPRNAPRLHSRTSKGLRRTKGYFRGSEAVSWLVKRFPVQCKDRATAVEVSDQLANLGTFNRIKPANADGFADSKKYIYRFAPILDKLHIQGALSDRASACRACPVPAPTRVPACGPRASFIFFSHIQPTSTRAYAARSASSGTIGGALPHSGPTPRRTLVGRTSKIGGALRRIGSSIGGSFSGRSRAASRVDGDSSSTGSTPRGSTLSPSPSTPSTRKGSRASGLTAETTEER